MPPNKRAKVRTRPAGKPGNPKRARPVQQASPKVSANMKLTGGLIAVALLVVGFLVWNNSGGDTPPPGSPAASEKLVRADSHRLLTAADNKVTLVEFLDFECESCGAAYPGVERIREEYKDKITYVVRFFPLPGHRNGMPAAKAAQAAALQGKFEPMYRKLFDTQKTWGEKQQDQSALFESYAAELGLDMTKYKADVASEQTAARVQADMTDGDDLNVTGTPTFFLNGQKFTGRPDYAGLKAAIDAALVA